MGLPPLPEVLALAMHELGAPYYRSTELLTVGNIYKTHGYDYYFNLLALRKHVGPIIATRLEQQLGRPSTVDEFVKEVQGQFGERGLRIAKKGLEAATSPNLLTDEELVLSAVLTGILRGIDVYILTWDIDLQEQFYKLLVLMEAHYGAMLLGANDTAHAGRMVFQPQRLPDEQAACYEGDSVLVTEMVRNEFVTILPHKPHPVYMTCLLIGGDKNNLKVTSTTFCAETEMASLLRMKSVTGGLNANTFDGKNIRVELSTFRPDEPAYRIYIGKERQMKIGAHTFSMPDAYDALYCNERTARYLPRNC